MYIELICIKFTKVHIDIYNKEKSRVLYYYIISLIIIKLYFYYLFI